MYVSYFPNYTLRSRRARTGLILHMPPTSTLHPSPGPELTTGVYKDWPFA